MPELINAYRGTCSQCQNELNATTLPVVTSWNSVAWGEGFSTLVPKTMVCRECAPASKPRATVVRVQRTSDLPFKDGSVMRSCIERALSGVQLSVLRAEVETKGARWQLQERVVRSGGAPFSHTHTWKVRLEGDVLFVYDVKPVAKKTEAASA